MYGMSAFMYHGSNIAGLSGSIHKDEWSASFCQRAVIPSGCFSFSAVEIEPFHFTHFTQTIGEEGVYAIETVNAFLQQLTGRTEGTSRLLGRRPAARFERDQIFLLGADFTKVYARSEPDGQPATASRAS